LKAVRQNLNHNLLPFEFPPQNAPWSGKPLVPSRFAPAPQGRLQDLLGCANQMLRRFDSQVDVLGHSQSSLPGLLGQFPIRQSL
jgi:hypothetical protein